MHTAIRYGKAHVALYRTYATPLSGLVAIPESPFTGGDNTLFAAEVDVEVLGNNFLPAYTAGDNANVVATDTMKNFILQSALDYPGATQEGLLHFLGQRFLETWPHLEALRLRSRQVPFAAAPIPGGHSGTLFSRSRDDYGYSHMELVRDDGEARLVDHQCGRLGLQLIKVTGSSFTRFVRDEYTTLPEAVDRPLFIYLDLFWRYGDVGDAVGSDHTRYLASEQVRDFVGVVFHDFVSLSIQHLVHEMGQRLLARFPQIAEVSFEAQNRLWDTAFVSPTDERTRVYCDPRPPYGSIFLSLARE